MGEIRDHGARVLLVEQNPELGLAEDASVPETGLMVLAGHASGPLADSRIRDAHLGT